MRYDVKSINFIKTIEHMSIVSLSVVDEDGNSMTKQFFTNDEKNDTVLDRDYTYNALSLKSEDGTILHNIYESSNPIYKSALYSVSKSKLTGMTYDFKNIFLHTENNSVNTDCVHVGNMIYATSPESIAGRAILDMDSYSYLSNDNGLITLPNRQIKTYTYDRNVISALANGLSSRDDLSSEQEIKNTFISVYYTPICEVVGNIYNDYQSGNIAINTYKCKNQYSSEFNMEHASNAVLKNCRSYVRIDACNDQAYLTYYDNVSYQNSDSNTKSKTKIVKKQESETGLYGLKLQHVESIQLLSRYSTNSNHRTSMYTLNLETDIFKNVGDQLKTTLKSEVKKVVKTIALQTLPIHALLYDVTITEI